MITKKIFKQAASLITAIILLCSCQPEEEAPEIPAVTGDLEVAVLKVGQADAIILQTEQHCVLIDCGEKDDGDEVSEYLASNRISTVDYLFVTHFDKDHVGGVAEVLDNVTVEELVTPAYEGTNDEYYSYMAAAERHDITPTLLVENMSFILDDVLFEVYPPMNNSYVDGDNDYSLAISVTHGENRFLFTGDAEKLRIAEILRQVSGTYDFLKVPHHGKHHSYSNGFFSIIKPKISVICCSDKNPEEEKTVTALESLGSSVYLTREGNVYAVSDGEKITINQ
ncbi:MAG: MBL fold metallo-hydrolase [Oscillospiraceae bacterium]|nr:MBL fold metallo-hydrolase [Oscillospiraceae bacterium]